MNPMPDPSRQFQGQGMIVIGAATPIGRAIVALAAERGACIVVDDPRGAAAVDHSPAEAHGVGVETRISSVAVSSFDEAGAEELFDQAVDRLPRLSVLIHCLEMPRTLSRTPLSEMTLADWDAAMRYGFREPFLCSQRAVQEFLATGEGGRIVYAVSPIQKGAVAEVIQPGLRALARSIAKEYGLRGIACNAVMPLAGPRPPRGAEDSNPAPRAYAETALFLASSQASFVNGEVLHCAESPDTPITRRHICEQE